MRKATREGPAIPFLFDYRQEVTYDRKEALIEVFEALQSFPECTRPATEECQAMVNVWTKIETSEVDLATNGSWSKSEWIEESDEEDDECGSWFCIGRFGRRFF